MKQTLIYEETKKLPAIFKKEDIARLLYTIKTSNSYLKNIWGKWMKARDSTILMTIYLLGLRPNEACSLRFDDFDLIENTVKIRGENNKVKKDRILPLPKKLKIFYTFFFSFPRERFWKGSPYLFPSFENQHISAQRWKAIFRNILKEAGIWKPPINSTIPPYRSYTLRHSRASELFNKSKDIFLVANFLGHSKLSSSKVYAHTDKNYKKYMENILDHI